jgi:hypothetical protein
MGLDVVLRADAVTRIYLNEICTGADVIRTYRLHALGRPAIPGTIPAGETAALKKLGTVKTVIHRATVTMMPQKTITEHIKKITDKIIEKVVGGK